MSHISMTSLKLGIAGDRIRMTSIASRPIDFATCSVEELKAALEATRGAALTFRSIAK